MNEQLFGALEDDLSQVLKEKFGIKSSQMRILVSKGQLALKETLKNHILKNGTKEAEDIICSKIGYHGSLLAQIAIAALTNDLKNSKEIEVNDPESISETAVNTLFEGLRTRFEQSGQTKDTEGVCKFLGIDPKLLKMVNSPVGKFFGKFIKK
ncbi:MAG: hypothetical protein IT245_05235 [Bacteroidia bacterium]|nr:hypothetical protein [Bacteroidia bacterium]